jgi:8-amino-7-oxononanoate synthase
MTSLEWTTALSRACDRRVATATDRALRTVEPVDAVHLVSDGRRLVNFASNNYLGLTHHPRVIAAIRDALAAYGAGSGAASLITGHTIAHANTERAVARWKGVEKAVLLPSGYAANFAAVGALAVVGRSAASGEDAGVRFLLDKLCHASLVDAVHGSGAAFRVFPHNGVDKLRRLLADAPAGQLQVVVTESIFSMDGDAADLAAIVALKREHEFLLLLDEAHGGGVYGPGGAGLAAELNLNDAVDLTVATFSKAAGVAGGAVCGSALLCDAVVNHGRSMIFTTAMPPAVAAGIEASLNVMVDEPWRAARVRALARRVREALGITTAPVDSPIIPIIVGDEATALSAAAELEAAGLLVVAVRPPTVARGTSRLRVTVSAEHSDDEVKRLIEAVRTMRLTP